MQEDTQRFARGVELFAGQVLDAVLTLVIFVPSLLELGAAFPPPGSSGGGGGGSRASGRAAAGSTALVRDLRASNHSLVMNCLRTSALCDARSSAGGGSLARMSSMSSMFVR